MKKEETKMINLNKQRLINNFVEFAKIISPSGQEEEMAVCVIKKLNKLGFIVQRDSYGNVIAKKGGSGEPIILCAHLDTVPVGGKEISPIVHLDRITSDGTTILGADNKDSIAAIFEAVEVINENEIKHRSVEIVFTKEEETISRGAMNLDTSLISGKKCIISDMAGDYGIVTLSAPFCYQFDINVHGKRCHPKNPDKGVDAGLIMAKAISNSPIGLVDDFTTSTISYQMLGLRGEISYDICDKGISLGMIVKNRNTIPDCGYLFGEVRGSKLDVVTSTLDSIKREFEKVALEMGGHIDFKIKKLAKGYYFDSDDSLVLEVSKILKEQGIEPGFIHSIGGSDANALNNKGIKSVVVSSAHRNNHQTSEYLILDDLYSLADFYYRLLIC